MAEVAFLEIKNVHKEFGAFQVLRGVNLDVIEHQVVCLIGPSGCGKSTLLRCINGLEKIQGGEIRLEDDRISGPGIDVNKLRQNVGIVFQSFNLFPHMSVIENVTLAPRTDVISPPVGRGKRNRCGRWAIGAGSCRQSASAATACMKASRLARKVASAQAGCLNPTWSSEGETAARLLPQSTCGYFGATIKLGGSIRGPAAINDQ
ncbi:ATP-binding cassette domain-containing protein [Mesorhizobium escarrei]|uniref:ABC transporter domain-containing protein n=1 Tax=Mesorhizobium escarrei TaxID=666018 RepID=A0ABN8JRY9_9HYPH|nr:ATP-binding cassette domain-containing protein [Mesorhizobium escarrei]CAH2400825.1 hypothetical protein MES5069_270065 [Mesorhizobium escarrei]